MHAQNGRCATCQVRLNGRSAVKVCQGPTVRLQPLCNDARGAQLPRARARAPDRRLTVSVVLLHPQIPGGATRKLKITLDNL